MRILAVIPARAGSKGIPNKNLRMVAGHPLIYYSLMNAVNSKYITDVVVTSDSYDIQTLTRQLGINVIEREESLCADETTLDDVVIDAVRRIQGDFDYIVTLQPTSPTLKKETLDNAIKYEIENGFDSLISVINKPHLAWKKGKVDRVEPAYERRVNRQYLPPYYAETGAFVISSRNLLDRGVRIDGNIGVYEIPEDESIDIDTFTDLIAASEILSRKKIAIYVNGNNKRGIGHIYRALEIADELYVKPDIFFDKNQTDISSFGNTKHQVIAINGITELFSICAERDYDIFINDILSTSIDYMIGLRISLPNAKIINIEDDGEGAYKADAVINALFRQSNIVNAYDGEKYYICRKLFLFYDPIEIRDTVKTMFVCFGGADPQNYTDRIIRMIIKPEYKEYRFIIAIGKAKENIDELLAYNSYGNIEVYYDVPNMPELMSQADFAVASRGRTCYELAMLGIPTISISENERELKHEFVTAENGFTAIGVDPEDDVVEEHIKMYFSMSKQVRKHYQDILLSHDLRSGRKNFQMIINSL
ncbi:CMP-N-acetylneuraminic acid synthetase [Oribacterium sp. KHPX15]|uniref:cytidylyltransferase domain-containing protein n=1 Tax=Oribacterium sp. KHPX15 TaxID=1855342 RepID=UPI00089B1B07|nr:glycosyltransferase [Oribacterium sp. KHPX15]SEA83356.1 CMP-N-acetylneuraminic acid synthetase [Oribacterium sp. KHPX15]